VTFVKKKTSVNVYNVVGFLEHPQTQVPLKM